MTDCLTSMTAIGIVTSAGASALAMVYFPYHPGAFLFGVARLALFLADMATFKTSAARRATLEERATDVLEARDSQTVLTARHHFLDHDFAHD